MPLIYLKTITRTVVKGLAAEQAKAQMTQDMGEGLAFFTRIATDLLHPHVVGYQRHPFLRDFWRYIDIDPARLP